VICHSLSSIGFVYVTKSLTKQGPFLSNVLEI